MNKTIDLMLNHTSVRRFTEESIEAEQLKLLFQLGELRLAGRISSLIPSL